MTPELAIGDELKNAIADIVRREYGAIDWEPLLLADLGAELAEAGLQAPGGRPGSLRRFIESELFEEFAIVRHPDIAAYIAVAPRDLAEEVGRRIIQRKVKSSGGIQPSDYPRSLLIAFCRTIPKGQAIAFTTSRPFRYETGKPPFPEGLVEIEEEFRLPGMQVPDDVTSDPALGEKVREAIERWAFHHGIDLLRIFSREASSAAESSKTALDRLLNGIPAHLRSQLRIPADIIELLLRHP